MKNDKFSTSSVIPSECFLRVEGSPDARRAFPNRRRSLDSLTLARNDTLRYFFTSLIAHVSIFLLFIWYAQPELQKIKFGNANKQIVSSYLVTENSSNTPKTLPVVQQHKIIKQLQNAIALTRKKVKSNIKKILASPHKRAAVKGAPMPELIALLHAGIQRQQHYPASAQEMEREGRTTLIFTLFANGTVRNIQVKNSSGTTSLDNAALAALNSAAPFKKVDKYLKKPQDYQIDVVFKLS